MAGIREDGAGERSAVYTALEDRDWPAPIFEFYLGRLPLETLRTAADTSEKMCELNFYLAEWHVSRAETAKAKPLLEAAVAGCPKDFIEYDAAVVELKRLAP